MKNLLCLGASLCLLSFCSAQNLLENGSFEEYTECPDQLNQMDRATGWSRFRGSPDFFHTCAGDGGIAGIPTNSFGYQVPATGNGYSGVLLWCDFPANSREHLGAMLTAPLQPGVPVFISFKVCPTTNGFEESMIWTSPGMGLRFTVNPYLQNGLSPLPNQAVVHAIEAPTDTAQWITMSGEYTPDSAYNYVVLGNFFNDSLITPVLLNPNGDLNCAYVFIDDVCVSYSAEECGVNTGWAERSADRGLRAFPDPFAERCTLLFERAFAHATPLQLFDPSGRCVWQATLPVGDRSIEIPGSGLSSGMYTVISTCTSVAIPPLVVLHLSP